MDYRIHWTTSRSRCVAVYDAEEALKYDAWVRAMSGDDHSACLQDLSRSVPMSKGMHVLDVGAGTGALCQALVLVPGLKITALEPCRSMLELLLQKEELSTVATVQGFCDHPSDRQLFAPDTFDRIASRQLVNGLFDPLAAFRNWHHWLRPNGIVAVMDGFFKRSDWSAQWADLVDALPLSCCLSPAIVAYLLEQCGFTVTFAGPMDATNALPSTRTERFMVVATKFDSD